MYQSDMVEQAEPDANPQVSTEQGMTITRKGDQIVVTGPGSEAPPSGRIPKRGQFDENLAGIVTNAGKSLAGKLRDYYDADREDRKDWEAREKRSLQMLGISDTIPDEDTRAPGMNSMTHPMLMEAAVRFSSNAITEIFPATGPVKAVVLGKKDAAKTAQAERIETFSNYYLTQVDREYFADTDQMLLYLPMAGSAFRKGGQNWVSGLPQLRYIKATNFIAPYAGTDLASMPRYAHEFTMTGEDIRRAVDSGMFFDAPLPKVSQSDARHAPTSDTADGRIGHMADEDELYTMLEYHVDLELAGDDKVTAAHKTAVRPYIVVMERDNETVFLIRRNWREKDPKFTKRMWFAHHKYLPGLGFYGFGLPHVIGSLGNAASGAVNALLDGAQMASFQGGFKTREGRGIAGEMRLEPGVWKDVDASYEDLAKSFYTPPVKEPGNALFNMLEHLVDAGQRFAGTTDASVGDGNNTGPVGTTIALIEQSQKPQSAIHKRLHKSFSDELKMFGELVHDFMGETYDYKIGGDAQSLRKSDFDGRVDVVSVTDPNIFSSTQRIQQAQALDQTISSHPDLFTPKKRAAAVRRLLEALKIPDIDEIMPEAEQPKYLDPVSENGLILAGKGVRAYETQDQAAHIKIHQHGAATVATQQMDPETQQMILTGYGVHIRDHMALQYRQQIMAAAGIPAPPLDEDGEPVELDPDTEGMITRAVLAKLPPPPQPPAPQPQQPSPAEIAQQKIESAKMLADAERQRKDSDAAAEKKRKDVAFTEEQTRLEAAHREALRRTDQAASAENKRKDIQAAAEVVRQGAKTGVQIRHAEQGHQAQHRQKAVGTHLTLRHQAEAAREKLRQQKEAAVLKAKHDREQARIKVETAKAALRAKKAAAKAKPKPKAKAK